MGIWGILGRNSREFWDFLGEKFEIFEEFWWYLMEIWGFLERNFGIFEGNLGILGGFFDGNLDFFGKKKWNFCGILNGFLMEIQIFWGKNLGFLCKFDI